MSPDLMHFRGLEVSTTTVLSWGRFDVAQWAAGRQGLLFYSATLLLSASLLFSVQPLFAKMVLPILGGTSSVWAVAMCFFQAALLAGYCYAHALNRWVSSRHAPLVHLAVCAAAFLALPFGLPDWATSVPEGNTYLWLLAILTAGVGLPFFAVSANAPLLQAWFAQSGHPHAKDPYFLYGASNLGSLASLLAYPFLIEPMIGIDAQSSVWLWGFGLLTAMLMACGALMIAGGASQSRAADGSRAEKAADKSTHVTTAMRLQWIGLALVPSALMVAFTSHITTDIASAPFLWVIPLATFLGTFVVVFRDKTLIRHDFVLAAHPYLVAAALLLVVLPNAANLVVHAAVGFMTFTVTTLVAHRALYDARPSADRLTEFYLWMSLGGVLGGMLAALLAPQVFDRILEYPLLIIAGLFARPKVLRSLISYDRKKIRIVLFGAAFVSLAGFFLARFDGMAANETLMFSIGVVSLMLIAMMAVFARRPEWLGKIGVATMVAVFASGSIAGDGFIERNFFGVSHVMDTADGEFRLLIHGSTMHGGERLKDSSGKPAVQPVPALYYNAKAPMARGFEISRSAKSEASSPTSFGIIGLGTGSLACHLKRSETMTFYEIDPLVVHIARDAGQFNFLTRCAPDANIVLGDARLTLARDEAVKYNYLVVDAFSSDAVPVHLLTREAIALYLSRVTDDGLVAMHISNRYLELESVIAATAGTLDGVYAAIAADRTKYKSYDGMASDVVFLSRNKAVIDKVLAWPDARHAKAGTTRPWSDNYADILSALWRRVGWGDDAAD